MHGNMNVKLLYPLVSRYVYCTRPEFDTMDILNALELSTSVDRQVMMSLPLQDYKWVSIAVCTLIKVSGRLKLCGLVAHLQTTSVPGCLWGNRT